MGFPTKVWMTRPYLWTPKTVNNEGFTSCKAHKPLKMKELWVPMDTHDKELMDPT